MSYLPTRWLVWPVIGLVAFFFFQNFRLTGLSHVGIELRPREPSNGSGETSFQSGSGYHAGPGAAPQFNQLTPAEKYSLVGDRQSDSARKQITVATVRPAPPIRIGSFALDRFGVTGRPNRNAVRAMGRILESFDVLAIQQLSEQATPVLMSIIDSVNNSGGAIELLPGPVVGDESTRERFAFVVNTKRIETDRLQLYSVDDPENLLNVEPLVGWFRVRGYSPQVGFTFTLINGRTPPTRRDRELSLLPEIVRSVRLDGRGEDDCILIGDFGIGQPEMSFLNAAGLSLLIQPNTSTDASQDNIAIPVSTAPQYRGRSGRFDFLRTYNLTIEESRQLSSREPVWAEFSPTEDSPG